jgi:hypothetical protein
MQPAPVVGGRHRSLLVVAAVVGDMALLSWSWSSTLGGGEDNGWW